MRAEPFWGHQTAHEVDGGVKEIHYFILRFQSELVGIGGERDFGAR